MPKRSATNKIEYYTNKIRKLKEKEDKVRRRRVIVYSSSDSNENSENESIHDEDIPSTNTDGVVDNIPSSEEISNDLAPSADIVPSDPPPPTSEEPVQELDADLLLALGDPIEETPKYGENIHQDLAQRWLPILKRGLTKENKEKIIKEYIIPENCKLLRAPTLNPEIAAALTDMARARDKKIETAQQQLGVGLTAINKAMSLLLTNDDRQTKIQAVKILSDGCRILTDLHNFETQSRIKIITPGLDKTFLNLIQDVERDETLFGAKLSEKIKASKTIEKQSLQIKKAAPQTSKTSAQSTSQVTAKNRYQGNWTPPLRSQQSSNRGGRGGGPQRPTAAARKQYSPAQASNQTKTRSYTKQQQQQRAPTRQ